MDVAPAEFQRYFSVSTSLPRTELKVALIA